MYVELIVIKYCVFRETVEHLTKTIFDACQLEIGLESWRTLCICPSLYHLGQSTKSWYAPTVHAKRKTAWVFRHCIGAMLRNL